MTTSPSALLAVCVVRLLSMVTDVCHKQHFGGWEYQGLHCWGASRRCLHDIPRVLRFMPVLHIVEIAYEGFILKIPGLGQVCKRSYSQTAMQKTMAHRIFLRNELSQHANCAGSRLDARCEEAGAHAGGIEG